MVANIAQYTNTQFPDNSSTDFNNEHASFEVTRNELAAISPVKNFHRVNHYSFTDMANAINSALTKEKYRIHSQQYVVNLDRMRMKAVIVLQDRFDDCLHAVEFQHSVLQALPLHVVPAYLTIGSSNLMMAGTYILITPKKANTASLTSAIQSAMNEVRTRYPLMERRVAMWKQTIVPHRCVKRYIYSACVQHRIVPTHLITTIHDNYFGSLGNDESFCEPTLWSLSNLFVRSLKALPPMQRLQVTLTLGNYLDKFSRYPLTIA